MTLVALNLEWHLYRHARRYKIHKQTNRIIIPWIISITEAETIEKCRNKFAGNRIIGPSICKLYDTGNRTKAQLRQICKREGEEVERNRFRCGSDMDPIEFSIRTGFVCMCVGPIFLNSEATKIGYGNRHALQNVHSQRMWQFCSGCGGTGGHRDKVRERD